MTRPLIRNGFGLTVEEAEREVLVIEAGMSLLPDNDATYRQWRKLVTQYGVSGVQVYDARLVAAMQVHGVSHLLTFNAQDFSRYSGLIVLHPSAVPAL